MRQYADRPFHVSIFETGRQGDWSTAEIGEAPVIQQVEGYMATCKSCGGKGYVPCPSCNGKGKKDIGGIWKSDIRECRHCSGGGRKKCGVCNGKGTV